MTDRTLTATQDEALRLSVSARGFAKAGGTVLRITVLAGCLFTLLLVRGATPVYVAIPAVSVTLVALYLVDRKSGRFGLWAAYLVGFVLFALLRTVTDETGIPVRAGYAVDTERWLFGGALPQEWLQSRLFTPDAPGPLALFVVAVLLSYFLVPHIVGLVLWRRDPQAFMRYAPAVLLTVYFGLVVSLALPTAPPWLAPRYTDAPRVEKVSAHVLGWNPEYSSGSAVPGSNPFAAMPSLHLAVTMLVVLVLWRYRVLRLMAIVYLASMAFALVYGGEHYVIDELAGAATAVLAWVVVPRLRLMQKVSAQAAASGVSTVAPGSKAD